MGVRSEIKNNILSTWIDKDVANWVIGKLPLLEYGFTHTPCPVYNLSLNNGLVPQSMDDNRNFLDANKLVISGGFEGTEAHIKVIEEMYEARALTANSLGDIVLMLEPDTYVRRQKNRDPLISLDQRVKLWSTSGLVEAIIVLPDKPSDVSPQDFYEKRIHELIKPASWCVNIEHPHALEILERGQKEHFYDLVRLFVHHIEVHTSFLNSTRLLKKDDVKRLLYNYLSELVISNKYTTTKVLSVDEEVHLYMSRIAEGL